MNSCVRVSSSCFNSGTPLVNRAKNVVKEEMTRGKWIKRQTIIYKTQHRKLKIQFIAILFAHGNDKDQTQGLISCEVISFELHNNYNKYNYGTQHSHLYR